MEDEQNREENEEQSLGKQAIDVGKQVAEQAAKNAGKKIAKKIGAKILAVIAPYIIPVIAGILIVVIIVGGLYAIIDHIRENSGEIQTAIATFLVAGDNGPIAPSPNEMVDLINKELEKSGLDKDGLYLGNGIQTDIYLYKFMTASLATQLPYIKDSTAKTLTDILKQTLVPGVNAIETFKSIVGQDVQGIVKIKRQTGNENKDLTYKKYEDFLKLIEENNENNQSSALDYFSIDESWMLCVAKKSKTTTKNPDNTQTEVNTITEVKIPYQTMISKYSIPFEFFITLQQTTQNAEYVSAVADMIQDGEIELTIFDQTEVIETTYTYRYKVRRKWIETQKISRETYKTEILSRSFIRTIDETKIASGKKRPTEEDSGKHDSGKNEEKDKTPSKPESSSSGKNEENNDNPNKGESSNTDKNEENNQKGENENLDKNEENGDASDDDVNKVNPVQKDETGEEQTEITVTIQEVNSIMASVTKADVWVIDQKATYIQDDISPEYPLGEDGITTDLGDEEGAGEAAEGTWQVERSETTKQTVTKEKWKLQSNIVDIDESEFLGLWKNAFGMYIPDTKPKYDSNGILVKYELPGKWLKLPKFESPIEKLESSEELLYDQLERSEYTQTHAQLMRYLIQFYKTKGEVKLDISDILSLFDVSEFNGISYGSNTVKDFIHYFEGKPKEVGGQYVVFDDGFGNLTVGWGIYIEKHSSRFLVRGVNISTLKEGSLVDKTIVDSIEDEIIEEYRNAVIQATAGLGLEEYQIDALTSRAYNCGIGGGLKGFVQAYNQYGNTEALYENLLSGPTTSNGKVAPGLVRRRQEEWQLFHSGYYANTNSYYTELSSGEYASIIVEKAKWCHDYLRNNKYKYKQAGISVPITSAVQTVDCSSYVSWVLYEAGFTEFAGHQKTSSYFLRNPMNWEKVSKENLQAGDILVYSGHVQIYAGDGQYYNCGGNKSIETVAPSTMGTSINDSTFIFGLRP